MSIPLAVFILRVYIHIESGKIAFIEKEKQNKKQSTLQKSTIWEVVSIE